MAEQQTTSNGAATGLAEREQAGEGQEQQRQIAKADAKRFDEMIVSGKEGLALTSMAEIFRFGQYVIQSGMFPQFANASQIVIVVQLAKDSNIPISQALQNICFINNRATMWGDALLAAAFGSGMLEDIREEIIGEGDQMEAVCTAKRRGMATPVVRTFSVDDAKKAKLWDAKDNWKKYPKRMLQMRARSYTLRDAGLTQGVIAREEIMDYIEAKAIEPTAMPITNGEKKKFGWAKQPEQMTEKGKAQAEPQQPAEAPPVEQQDEGMLEAEEPQEAPVA